MGRQAGHTMVICPRRYDPALIAFSFTLEIREEPIHIHVERDDAEAKYWLQPVRLQRSSGLGAAELNRIEKLVEEHRLELIDAWIYILATETRPAIAVSVQVSSTTLEVSLADGRTIAVPLAWYPRLLHATAEERGRWRLIGSGQGIHWPDLDEDISVANLLDGQASGESQESLGRWLKQRGV
jgi:hypothetical protein